MGAIRKDALHGGTVAWARTALDVISMRCEVGQEALIKKIFEEEAELDLQSPT